MKYDKLNSIKKLNNVFLVEDLKIYEKLNYFDKLNFGGVFDIFCSSITILNDSVIMINDIKNFLYSLNYIITHNDLLCDFTKNEIEYIKNIVKQMESLK